MNSSRYNPASRQEDSRKTENKRAAVAIAKENADEAAYRKGEKIHEKEDDVIRNDYVTKLRALDDVNEKQHQQDTFDRNHEYGNDLLKQIEENKQRKETIHREELAQDHKRNESSKQQRNDLHEFNENTKRQNESKELHRHDVAMTWRAENNHKMAEQGKLTDLAAGNVNFEDDEWGYNTEVHETLRRIRARRVLLEDLQEKIEASYRKFEEDRKEHERVLSEIQVEVERLRKLKQEQLQQVVCDEKLQSMTNGNEKKN